MPAAIAATTAAFQMVDRSEYSPSILIEIEIVRILCVRCGRRNANVSEDHVRRCILCRMMRECGEAASAKTRWLQTQIGKMALNSYRNGCRFTPARAFVKTSVGDAATIR